MTVWLYYVVYWVSYDILIVLLAFIMIFQWVSLSVYEFIMLLLCVFFVWLTVLWLSQFHNDFQMMSAFSDDLLLNVFVVYQFVCDLLLIKLFNINFTWCSFLRLSVLCFLLIFSRRSYVVLNFLNDFEWFSILSSTFFKFSYVLEWFCYDLLIFINLSKCSKHYLIVLWFFNWVVYVFFCFLNCLILIIFWRSYDCLHCLFFFWISDVWFDYDFENCFKWMSYVLYWLSYDFLWLSELYYGCCYDSRFS